MMMFASPCAASTSGAPAAASREGAGADVAQLFAWLGLALVNAGFIAAARLPRGGCAVRALHHLYDAGQLAAVGLVVAAVVRGYLRFGPRRVRWAYVAITAASVAVGALTLVDDVSGPAEDLGGARWTWAWNAALVVVVALGIPAAAFAGRLCRRRPWLRGAGVAVAASAAVANELILRADYPGAHLYLAWAAATLGGAAMTGVRLARLAWPSWARWSALACAAVAGASTVVAWPREAVVLELSRIEGAVVMRQLARLRSRAPRAPVSIPTNARPWFEPRAHAPDVPASSPPLLPRNAVVVVVTIDSMRADVLDSEAKRSKLPRITELLSRSVQFTHARSPGMSTRNALGSLFAGKYRSQLRWSMDRRKGSNLSSDSTPRFPKLLTDAGVSTFTAFTYQPVGRQSGIVSGFADEVFVRAKRGQPFGLSEAQVDAALRYLDRRGDGPLFMFMHFMDPHDPYDAADTKGSTFDRYLAEIALCDASVGRLWDALERKRLLDRAALVVSADHGEALGQHGIPHHGGGLYDEIARVPLIVWAPGVRPRRVDAPVSLLDLGPTVLDLFHLPTPGSYMGQSLVPFLRGETPVLHRPIVADTGVMRSMLIDHFKVIENDIKGSKEIYDLERDPEELDNLYDSLGAVAEERLALLDAFFTAHRIKGAKKAHDVR